MIIDRLRCDICSSEYPYPFDLTEHQHPELEIGGVPMNIWTQIYKLPQQGSLHLSTNSRGVMKFRDYLPVDGMDVVSLDEGFTPLMRLVAISDRYGSNVYLKDERGNPTGSFKDRGMPLMTADIKKSGKGWVAIPSTGNAAISLVHYAKHNGIKSMVFVPSDISHGKMRLLEEAERLVFCDDLVRAYEDFFSFCKAHPEVYNGFPVTNIPYSHGLKTIAYEIFLGLGERVPEWLVVPCGSGGNTVSQYQGFTDLYNMGLTDRMPRFVTVQIQGADPITIGYRKRQFDKAVLLDEISDSRAEAIASDTCFNYFKILEILERTRGVPVSVTDQDIDRIHPDDLPELEFSSQSVYASLEKLKEHLKSDETVVLIGTGCKRGY